MAASGCDGLNEGHFHSSEAMSLPRAFKGRIQSPLNPSLPGMPWKLQPPFPHIMPRKDLVQCFPVDGEGVEQPRCDVRDGGLGVGVEDDAARLVRAIAHEHGLLLGAQSEVGSQRVDLGVVGAVGVDARDVERGKRLPVVRLGDLSGQKNDDGILDEVPVGLGVQVQQQLARALEPCFPAQAMGRVKRGPGHVAFVEKGHKGMPGLVDRHRLAPDVQGDLVGRRGNHEGGSQWLRTG